MTMEATLNNITLQPATVENTIRAADGAAFVAINYISCDEHYREQFEQMFKTRAGAIDRMPGFISMEVLKPSDHSAYLIVSRWQDEAAFQGWLKSPEFLEGHQRGFGDLKQYKARGERPPLGSDFKVYGILTN
jgi:heme-degrading monooxygenase HmoA